ncbi:MAG: outer membrane beta-barrel protein [Pseudomonadales bacterium]|nr:outer membrane beta-barrel protein [Pseudomonadales bacterium]
MGSASRLFSASVLTTSLAFGAGTAAAAEDHWGYAGASIGNAKVKIQDDLRVSEWDTAWKVYGGYMFNENIGAEFTWHDMGSVRDGAFRVTDLNGAAAQVIGVLPLGSFDLFGKIGYMYYDAEFQVGTSSPTRTGFELAAGFGARYNVGNFGIRAEAEAFDVGFADLYVLSIGAQYRF